MTLTLDTTDGYIWPVHKPAIVSFILQAPVWWLFLGCFFVFCFFLVQSGNVCVSVCVWKREKCLHGFQLCQEFWLSLLELILFIDPSWPFGGTTDPRSFPCIFCWFFFFFFILLLEMLELLSGLSNADLSPHSRGWHLSHWHWNIMVWTLTLNSADSVHSDANHWAFAHRKQISIGEQSHSEFYL